MAYLDTMMSEYGIPFAELWEEFPVCVGFALLEARAERHGGGGISFVDREGLAAMRATRERLQAEYRIIE